MREIELPAGVRSRMEFFMRFAFWATRVEKDLTPELVRCHFGVSRATAYRYIDAWQRARRR